MRRLRFSSVFAMMTCTGTGLFPGACSEQTPVEETTATGLAMTVNADLTSDVAGFSFTVTRVSCAGETFPAFNTVVTRELNEMTSASVSICTRPPRMGSAAPSSRSSRRGPRAAAATLREPLAIYF